MTAMEANEFIEKMEKAFKLFLLNFPYFSRGSQNSLPQFSEHCPHFYIVLDSFGSARFHPSFWWGTVLFIVTVVCVVLFFVFFLLCFFLVFVLCLVYPLLVSELSILDCAFGFLWRLFKLVIGLIVCFWSVNNQ